MLLRLPCHAAMTATLMASLTCLLAGSMYASPPMIITGTLLLAAALGIEFFIILLESFRNQIFALDETEQIFAVVSEGVEETIK